MKRFAILAAIAICLLCASSADARNRNRVRLLIVERPAVLIVESNNFLALRSFGREFIEVDRYGRRVLVTVDAFGVRRVRLID